MFTQYSVIARAAECNNYFCNPSKTSQEEILARTVHDEFQPFSHSLRLWTGRVHSDRDGVARNLLFVSIDAMIREGSTYLILSTVEDQMTALSKIEGIGDAYAEKLQSVDVTSIEVLLEKGASAKGRKALAEITGISDALILKWVNRADLFRVKGLGEQYTDLLEKAGVDTVPELAQRKAENLFKKLEEVNVQKNLVKKLPTIDQVAGWIDFAGSLPRVVEY